MFGADQSLTEVASLHKGADWGFHGHFECDDLILWHVEDRFSFFDVPTGVHTSIISRIVAQFKLIKFGTSVQHPVKHPLEALFLSGHWNILIFFGLFLSKLQLVFVLFIVSVHLAGLLEVSDGLIRSSFLIHKLVVCQTLPVVGL